MAVALGRAQAACEVALAGIVEVAGAGICVDEQALFQAARSEAGAQAQECQVRVNLAACAANVTAAVAETCVAAELLGETLCHADHQALAMFVAAGDTRRAVGAQITGQGAAPQARLANLQVGTVGEGCCGAVDQGAQAQQVAGRIGMNLATHGGLHAAQRAGIDGRLQVIVVGAVGT
ncbi:hypothetical protein D3C81_995650 [compost metagenome]